MAAPELAGLGVAVEIDPALSSERVWAVLERKVQRPQDYLPAEDVVARPNGDGGTYREMTVMGSRIIEDIYCTGAPQYEVLFKVRCFCCCAARPGLACCPAAWLTAAPRALAFFSLSARRWLALPMSTSTSSPRMRRACAAWSSSCATRPPRSACPGPRPGTWPTAASSRCSRLLQRACRRPC